MADGQLQILSIERFVDDIGELLGLSLTLSDVDTAASDLGIDSLGIGEVMWFVEGLPGASSLDEEALGKGPFTLRSLYQAYVVVACRLGPLR